MDKIIKADLYRHGGLDGTKGFLKGLLIPDFKYMYLLRKASQHKKYSFFGLFYRFFLRKYGYRYGFQIPVETQIGEGFYIGHFGPIVINAETKIGKNCNITHGVTIGKTFRGKLKGTPILGDNIWIGTGSVIVGNIKIGSNVMIAPNSFVNIDIPSNSLVLGNPAKIIIKENPTQGYINYMLLTK